MADYVDVVEWASAGLLAAQQGGTSGGLFTGFAELDATDVGLSSGMRELKGIISAPPTVADERLVDIPGNNSEAMFTFPFSSGRTTFDIESGVTDLDAEAAMQGSTVYDLGDSKMGVRGSSRPTRKNQVLMLTRDALSAESDSYNEPGYETLLIGDATLRPRGDANWANAEGGRSRTSVTTNKMLKLPWGVAVATAFTLNDGTMISISSPNPPSMHVFIGDNEEDEVTLDYTPTGTSAVFAFNAATGEAVAVTSVTGKVVKFTAAPASGVHVVIYYLHTGFNTLS